MQQPETSANRVNVHLGERSYHIDISSGQFDQFATAIARHIEDFSHAAVIADEAVDQLWATSLATGLEGGSLRVSKTTIASGEPSKSIEQFEKLLQRL